MFVSIDLGVLVQPKMCRLVGWFVFNCVSMGLARTYNISPKDTIKPLKGR